ncbi:1-acyl-sn-glycerol-3-phosphate acyltransferase [Victivallaceae bacterium BBE-744-WT-12]|jgi:1-acyl-sn-glycerol-3-phosphate acyltransferase|uniref:1-acyl-sn-glycerol-3-phosphate acyltransferase n=3 Tax=Victivallis lenta TaxID=2606640 RepID=A0A844FYJ2_9BACT|nr:1-acyl-sn-glycerol-3-phosphate acyltransferase [Victivallales bacterium CCUG 44730]MST95804.1 1-acyl-sn-glycerol-3-phosphate acyltransferase [Victivallis lenta]HBP06813.1 1-acyl-sn-glycerol-3-phosphate acyltransferase [Lentisphaeria bacterium]HCH87048.1 1-acyl-sn-glycerol-3-phosphate acyltransferase [Lentisphaeria bacterium]
MEHGQYLFAGDAYDTPESMRKSMLYRLSLGSRWYFYLNNFGIFARTGRCGRRGRLDKERQIYYSNKNFRLVEKCGGRIHLRGLENLRDVSGEPVVLIGNHMSLLETALFHAVAREYLDFTFVIKQSLLTVPFFRDIMRSLGAIPVGRENPRDDLRAVLGDGKKVLESGRSIIIFPQSTRSETFDAAKFNSIGIKLAKSAGVRVLPFALKTDFLGNGKYLRDMGPVRPKRGVYFEFAPARAVEGNGQALQQEIIGFIQSRLASWQAMDSEQ